MIHIFTIQYAIIFCDQAAGRKVQVTISSQTAYKIICEKQI